jgi:hypothetical protein
MTSRNPDLNALAQQMNSLRPTYRPLSPHFAVGVDAHVRMSYAVMLASVALGKGPLDQHTATVLELILDALELHDHSAHVLAQANLIDLGGIKEFLDLARRHKLAAAFLLDALVLSCVEGPLTEGQQALLAEVADFLDVTETQMSRITFWASHILGCPIQARLPAPYLKVVTLEKSARNFVLGDKLSLFSPSNDPHFLLDQLPRVGLAVRKNEIIGQTNDRYLNSKMVKLIAKCPSDGVLVDVLVGGKDKVKPDQEVARIATLPDYCAAWRPVLGFEDLAAAPQGEAP